MINVDELLKMKDKDLDNKLKNMSSEELEELYKEAGKEFLKALDEFVKSTNRII